MIKIIEKLSQLPVAALYEAGSGALPNPILPLQPDMELAGPALPVQCVNASNLPLHRAIYDAAPGDILVIATKGLKDHALLGDLLVLAAKCQKLGGIVIDGYIRDREDIEKLDLPVFCRGTAVEGPTKETSPLANIRKKICIGKTTINPGDFVRGDGDGVVVIAKNFLTETIKHAEKRLATENNARIELKTGKKQLWQILKLKEFQKP